jgi:hypothetical protein
MYSVVQTEQPMGGALVEADGAADGAVEGDALSDIDGAAEGDALGDAEGAADGDALGDVAGVADGDVLGNADGAADGGVLGDALADADRAADGTAEGDALGDADGAAESCSLFCLVFLFGGELMASRCEQVILRQKSNDTVVCARVTDSAYKSNLLFRCSRVVLQGKVWRKYKIW